VSWHTHPAPGTERCGAPALEGRLQAPGSMGSRAVTARIRLAAVDGVDSEVTAWLQRAYAESA